MGALRPGEMLAGTSYQVVRQIGAGGMGVVYEIEHVRLKKRYVAKIIHEMILGDPGAVKRMEREAQVLAGISHPNIVQVHDVGATTDGVSYFVMEKLEGVDLRFTMKHGGFPRLRSIEIVADILEALEYVHKRGVVHRDIKPENIFLSEQPHGIVAKLLDFGVAHVVDSDGHISQNRITKTGGFVGTLYYAAPEQMQGKPAGPPNDVYAAGLVLFELIARKGPFDDDPGVGLSRCFKAAPRLIDLVSRTPVELSDAVARALEQDPDKRPSAAAFAKELRVIAQTLRNAPNAFEEEALSLEVVDLLRNMNATASVAARTGMQVSAKPATPIMHPHPGQSSVAMAPTMASPAPGSVLTPSAGLGSSAPVAQPTLGSAGVPLPSAQAMTPMPKTADTTNGLYATIDGSAPVSTQPTPTPRFAFIAVGVLAVLAFLSIGGALTYRKMHASSAAHVPPTVSVSSLPSSIGASSSRPSVNEPEPAASAPQATAASSSVAPPPAAPATTSARARPAAAAAPPRAPAAPRPSTGDQYVKDL